MIPGDFQIRKPSRIQVLILGILGIGGLVGAVVGLVLGAFVITAWLGLPLDVFGLNEGPEQPIAFPHTTHGKRNKILIGSKFDPLQIAQAAASRREREGLLTKKA